MQDSSKKLRSIFLVSFLFFAHFSVSLFINSTALERFVDAQYTSLFFVFGGIGSIILLFILPRIIKRFGLVRTSLTIFILLALTLLLLGTTTTPLVFTTVFVLYSALISTVWYCNDLFVAHYTASRTAGHTRGIYLTITNTATVIMPLVTGILVAQRGISSVYIVAAALVGAAILVIIATQRKFVDREYAETTIASAWSVIRKAPSLRRILSIAFLLQFFYAWMTIFSPLYMYFVLGFSWTQIGAAFSFMLLPFILLQYKIGKLADSIGEKKMMLFALTVAGLSTIAFALLEYGTHSIIAYAAVLFCTRVGACMVEVLSETYFFKQISDKDESVVSVFRMMRPLAFVIAPLAGWYIVATTSYSVLFVLLGTLLLTGTVYALRLVDIR